MIVPEYLDLSEKGGYVLSLRLDERCKMRIGRLGDIKFDSGYYVYVGSAMRGLRQRILRHLRPEKKLHWHIDYLLEKASIENIIVCNSEEKIECTIASEILKVCKVINRFGSTDCHCPGHLFFNPVEIRNTIMQKLESTGLKPRLLIDEKDKRN